MCASPTAAINEKTTRKTRSTHRPKIELACDLKALSKLHLVAVAYSYVERDWFPTEEAYEAERECEYRAQDVVQELSKLNIPAKAYAGDQYFFTNLLVDKPDLVLNLVDTLRGKDSLQTSVPAALELANIPYTGAGMQGLVIGNDRNLFKQLLVANQIPTPTFQFIRRKGTKIDQDLGLPLIVKLNESGGSVGIDNNAVKETYEQANDRVQEMIETYHIPVVAERFINGPEITVIVFDDGVRKHIFMGEKVFKIKPDGKHSYTSFESYGHLDAYKYKKVKQEWVDKITPMAEAAFSGLHFKDYAKFDVRMDEESETPYFTDANPNTAFGPYKGLPFTEVLALHGVKFKDVLASMMSKYAKKIEQEHHPI
ncbi:MAG: hypothetical protein ACM3PY_12105 [Omnitrophica WOR_2 bacterium]